MQNDGLTLASPSVNLIEFTLMNDNRDHAADLTDPFYLVREQLALVSLVTTADFDEPGMTSYHWVIISFAYV